MTREMRRIKQLLSEEKTIEVMERNTAGVLAVLGDDDYPYAVPISYVYADGKVYMHSAKEGHKVDAARNHEKASFCVIDKDQIVPEEYTTYFRSAIAFGKIRLLEGGEEKQKAAELIGRKYYPAGTDENLSQVINEADQRFIIIALDIEHMTGKEAIELVQAEAKQTF